MKSTVGSNDLREMLYNNSSLLPEISKTFQGEFYAPLSGPVIDVVSVGPVFETHKALALSNTSAETVQPLYYVRFQAYRSGESSNSSANVSESIRGYYGNVEEKLIQWSLAKDEDRPVEEGAVRTALFVVEQLKNMGLFPPEMTWSGGDAVVMLWSMGDTTYAITVTDGEFGYVVRRNHKAIKMVDSISVETFILGHET
jgi:hypothetical protein